MAGKKASKRAYKDVPDEVAAIRKAIEDCFSQRDKEGRIVGNAKYGVYAFYDYDSEPIYVGQTSEKLRSRIGRHLTNQRTDAVAMNVLDPFEVLEVEMWPLWDLNNSALSKQQKNEELNRAEYTVYQQALDKSKLRAVLNEKDILIAELMILPHSVRHRIVPDQVYQLRKHPDIRIARRASTVANLARVISERDPSSGLRRTLFTQTRRLELLAGQRWEEIGGPVEFEKPGEETGENIAH